MESGYHSERWFDLDRLFDDPAKLRPAIAELGRRLARQGIQAVCGPLTGGGKLAELPGAELKIPCFFAERIVPESASGLFPVRYEIAAAARFAVEGKAIAIVDDAISAGSAIRGTYVDLLRWRAHPVAFGALWVFGTAADGFAAETNLPLEALFRESFGMWKPTECPLCQRGVPLEAVSA